MTIGMVPQKTMLHSYVGLATDDDVRMLVLQIGKKVQSEYYRAIG
jgi:hypothetical protein